MLGFGVGIGGNRIGAAALDLGDCFSAGEIELRFGAGEIQELAPADQRRVGRPHVHLARPEVKDPFDYVFQLGAAYDRVFTEQQSLAFDVLADGNELHPCNQVPDPLLLGHEAAWPSGSVLYERPPIGDPGFGGVAYGMADAGVGDSRYAVDLDMICACQRGPASIAHQLDIDALIPRSRVAEIYPEKRADLHPLTRWRELFHSIGCDAHDFAGAELAVEIVAEIRQGAGFQRHGNGAVFSAEHDGSASEPVPTGIDPVAGQKQNRAGTLDHFLHMSDAVDKGRAAIDESGDHLRLIELATFQLAEVSRAVLEGFVNELFEVVEPTYRDDRVRTVMRPDQERLIFVIADHSEPRIAVITAQIGFELGPKGGV